MKYWLSRTYYGLVYIGPRRHRDAEQETEVSEAFVLRHLNRLPTRAIRFTRNDQSFQTLMHELEGAR